ncbi:PH domain-containing protein [Acinetobacter baumannii]
MIAKSGLIRRNTIELKVNRVESLGVDQSITGRIFNFGSVVVKGTGGSHAPIPYIARPLEFRQQVNHYLDELDDNGKIAL